MEANALMIGDWVTFVNGKGERIADSQIDINSLYTAINAPEVLQLEPIPLTPGILEKNGFTVISDRIDRESDAFINLFEISDNIVLGSDGGCYVLCHEKWNSDWDCYEHSSFCEIKMVHEFQHALRLLSIEKEIEL